MLQTLLPLFALALPPVQEPGQEPAPVREPEALALLEKAAAAAAALKSGSYHAASQVQQGHSQAPPSVAQGRVSFERLEEPGPLDAQLAVDATVPGGGPTGGDLSFKIGYDGTTVRGRFGAEKVIWEGAPNGDGAEILFLGEPLIMDALHARSPFSADLAAPDVRLGEDEEVGGVVCHTVLVKQGPDKKGAQTKWFLSKEDHLPRRRVAQRHKRGVYTVEMLEINKLVKNPKIYPAVFALPVPGGFEVKPFVSQRPKGPELLAVGSSAPMFKLKNADGETRTLEDYRGKILVLDFWGTWCPPCRQAMPLVQKIHERFADSDDVAVVGISTGERRGADPAGYMKKNGFTYECLLGGEAVAPDYKALGLPTFYVVGPYGKVLHGSVGFEPDLDQTIIALIEKALAGQG